MQGLNLGPVLFREECIFKKEIRLGDKVFINLELVKARKDFRRWSIKHTIFVEDLIAAIVTVEGAWMDTVKRKLITPPAEAVDAYNKMPVAQGFQWL